LKQVFTFLMIFSSLAAFAQSVGDICYSGATAPGRYCDSLGNSVSCAYDWQGNLYSSIPWSPCPYGCSQGNCLCPNCQNGGTSNNDCSCTCISGWTGSTCQTCSLSATSCVNNGTFDATNCGCNCAHAITCQNGAGRANNCACNCINGWSGTDCSLCPQDASFCTNAGKYLNASCSCDCSHSPCLNGRLNAKCQCKCASGFSGLDCSQKVAAPSPSAAHIIIPSLIIAAVAAAACF